MATEVHRWILIFIVAFNTHGCNGLRLLSPASHAGLHMHSPASRVWAGPASFSLNTSTINAQLFDLGTIDEAVLCQTIDEGMRMKLEKRIVVMQHQFGSTLKCRMLDQYENLHEAGVSGIIEILPRSIAPGFGHYFRGLGKPREFIAASRRSTPFIALDRDNGDTLLALLDNAEAQEGQPDVDAPVYMILEPDENEWVDMYDGWAFFIICRMLVPLGYFAVMVLAFAVAASGFGLGTTKCWVICIEGLPAAALAAGHAMGCGYFDSSFLSYQVHQVFFKRFIYCEVLSTFLVARFWHAHATAVSDETVVTDPQLDGWIGISICGVFLALDAATCATSNFGGYETATACVGGAALANLLAMLYLVYSCGNVVWSQSANSATHLMGGYLLLSCGFIGLSILVTIFALWCWNDPWVWFTFCVAAPVARIGTGVCQLTVFLPARALKQRGHLVVPKQGPMDSAYLQGENIRLRNNLDAVQSHAASEKEVLLGILLKKNAELDTALRKVRSKQKAERLLHHNVKNAIAEASAGIELHIGAHPEDGSESMCSLQGAAKKLSRALRMTWRANQIASIFEGSYKASAETFDIHSWATASALCQITLVGRGGRFSILEPVVAEMYLAVTMDNVLFHGVNYKPVVFRTDFSGGRLLIDICNDIFADEASAEGHRIRTAQCASFSTGLGLGDLHEICKLRGIAFESAQGEDGMWHSKIELQAEVAIMPKVSAQPEATKMSNTLMVPPIRRVAIIDDLPLNMKCVARHFFKNIEGVAVDTFPLNTTSRYSSFVQETLQAVGASFDVVLLDQMLEMEDDGSRRLGTNLIPLIKKAGCKGCIIMNSANNTADDITMYKSYGAFGVVGKGSKAVYKDVVELHRQFHMAMGDRAGGSPPRPGTPPKPVGHIKLTVSGTK